MKKKFLYMPNAMVGTSFDAHTTPLNIRESFLH